MSLSFVDLLNLLCCNLLVEVSAEDTGEFIFDLVKRSENNLISVHFPVRRKVVIVLVMIHIHTNNPDACLACLGDSRLNVRKAFRGATDVICRKTVGSYDQKLLLLRPLSELAGCNAYGISILISSA